MSRLLEVQNQHVPVSGYRENESHVHLYSIPHVAHSWHSWFLMGTGYQHFISNVAGCVQIRCLLMALDSPEILKDHDCFTQQPAPTQPAKFRFPKQVGEKIWKNHPHIEKSPKFQFWILVGKQHIPIWTFEHNCLHWDDWHPTQYASHQPGWLCFA